jgi:uncharacterized circularly permuted ATP-grasp superfamily protein
MAGYRPNLGFIGEKEVATSNYLFRQTSPNEFSLYPHAEHLLSGFVKRSPEEHFIRSELLTEFIRKRGLTFSKKSEKGEVRTFSVPCTNSIVPLAKSTFNTLELHAQAFVLALRWIMQSIYGSPSIEESEFVQALPEKMRAIFIDAVKNCPQYFSELHHPVMRDYPFFEVVGLDLVLVEDYAQKVQKIFDSTDPVSFENLPFRLLEINAGSPSGASNNNSVLEGLMTVDPDFSKITDRLLPNDHFDLLRAAFDSIGRTWTKKSEGISVILPPGGGNGAAPEIHQLAAYSGMPWIDTNMLYTDDDGNLRLHTLSGENPIVTSIYSRVNADAALYDPKRNILMRDAETGQPLFEEDSLAKTPNGEPVPLKDRQGKSIPLKSIYAIPDAVRKIHERKLFLGGLNRILDNKLILATLTQFGPIFYAERLKKLGLGERLGLQPPETLAPERESLDIILKKPEDWVIKAPDLSGGSGVHILLTLSEKKRRKVLQDALKTPDRWAYQRLVKIARIPVAIKEKNRVRFANLAADIRLWCFFGDGATFKKPRLTHNGLVRFAPEERGPLSSIVNTSKGGGYAPLLIVDDIGSKESCSVVELTQPKVPAQFLSNTPIFSGAQIYQIHRQLLKAHTLIESESTIPSQLYVLMMEIKSQLNEVLCFLHPRNVEPLSNALELLERKTSPKRIESACLTHQLLRARVVEAFQSVSAAASLDLKRSLHEWAGFSELYPLDPELWQTAKEQLSVILLRFPEGHAGRFSGRLKQILDTKLKERPLTDSIRKRMKECLEAFSDLAFDRLSQSEDRELAYLFKRGAIQKEHVFDEEIGVSLESERAASLWEERENRKILESSYVSAEMRAAIEHWANSQNQVERVFGKNSSPEKQALIERKRIEHFKRFPFLAEVQSLTDEGHNDRPEKILKILPYLPYARFAIEGFLRDKKQSFAELFSEDLEHARATLFSQEEILAKGLTPFSYGECFAKKRYPHALFSESDIVTWISKDSSPLIQAITLGHEFIHYYQIEEFQNREKKARQQGAADFAKFLNLYGNVLGESVGAIEQLNEGTVFRRTILYGLPDLKPLEEKSKMIRELIQAYRKSEGDLEKFMERQGASVSWMMPENTALQLKALREVLPCVENIRNLHFIESLGVRLPFDLFRWAVPQASPKEVQSLKPILKRLLTSPKLENDALYWIAQHQFTGVRTGLTLKPRYHAVHLSQSYGSAQQQQQQIILNPGK